ncbi:YtxH domain-containing protein [Kurthia sibirica]|uniref:YtxH domain-containing protein n=1 Tax=Kurthia sibirica TaxID=202750 RepID=A0A2U3AL75_9BACL|nr:YtxH domain-containing protein [Kurthia sibirica]PWI25293.1 YtxH domain-containing protein [Kurthia sibirica]GEK34648.1 hypothetical protein KSI01_21810 [Kurthia sibirica]
MANKLVLGMVVGAAVGAGISLLNKETREKTARQVTNVKTDIQYYMNTKGEVKENVGGKLSTVKGLVANIMENKEYYLEKISELKSLTPAVTAMLADTKQSFANEEQLEAEEKLKTDSVIHL